MCLSGPRMVVLHQAQIILKSAAIKFMVLSLSLPLKYPKSRSDLFLICFHRDSVK